MLQIFLHSDCTVNRKNKLYERVARKSTENTLNLKNNIQYYVY